MDSTRIKAYSDLLDIRLKAARRNTAFSGAVWIVFLVAFFALGMLGELTGLGLFVAAAILIIFAFAFTASLIRRETLAGMRQLCSVLMQDGKPDLTTASKKRTNRPF